MKSNKKEEKNKSGDFKKILKEALKEWKVIENCCKSAYFISNPIHLLGNKVINE